VCSGIAIGGENPVMPLSRNSFDLENIILTGEIIERQRDAKTREVKCVVAGITLDGTGAETVVKVGFTGKLVAITVYVS
jgi:hypothetical protein